MVGSSTTVDDTFVESHTTCVFHCTSVELGHNDLVVLLKRIRHPKCGFEEFKALFGDQHEVFNIKVFSERLAAVKSQRVGAVFACVPIGFTMEIASNNCRDVCGHDFCCSKVVTSVFTKFDFVSVGVAENFPLSRCINSELVGGF